MKRAAAKSGQPDYRRLYREKMRECEKLRTELDAANAGRETWAKQAGEYRRKLDALPADWQTDSSLETWFPFTAMEVKLSRAENDGSTAMLDVLSHAILSDKSGYLREIHTLYGVVCMYREMLDHTEKERDEARETINRLCHKLGPRIDKLELAAKSKRGIVARMLG